MPQHKNQPKPLANRARDFAALLQGQALCVLDLVDSLEAFERDNARLRDELLATQIEAKAWREKAEPDLFEWAGQKSQPPLAETPPPPTEGAASPQPATPPADPIPVEPDTTPPFEDRPRRRKKKETQP